MSFASVASQLRTWLASPANEGDINIQMANEVDSTFQLGFAHGPVFHFSCDDGFFFFTEEEKYSHVINDANELQCDSLVKYLEFITRGVLKTRDGGDDDDEDGDGDDDSEPEELELELDDDDDEPGGSSSAAAPPPRPTGPSKEDELRSRFGVAKGARPAEERIMADLINLEKTGTEEFGFSARPIDDDLFRWEVRLFGFESSSGLHQDLQEYKRRTGKDYISMEMTFPHEYPFKPPFIRVVEPRMAFHTGHVTIGGSICMELLTTSGWMPTNDIESILISIRTQIVEGNGRLDRQNMTTPYTLVEAQQAFQRVARQHNWEP